jgi:hypothetical protein
MLWRRRAASAMAASGLPLSLRRCNARTMRPRPQVRRDDDDVGTRQSTGLKRAPTSWRPRIEQPSVRRARVAGLPPQLQPRAFQFDHAWSLTPVTLLGAAMVGRLPLIWIDVQFQIPRTFDYGRPFCRVLRPKAVVLTEKSARRVNSSGGQGLAGTACEGLDFKSLAVPRSRRSPPQVCVLPTFGARHTVVHPKQVSLGLDPG